MPDSQLARFLSQYYNSTAYHEAGHVTAAVLQSMPLRERGIHVDMEGWGISYYWHRSPGNPGRLEADQLERKRTIIALYSGLAAQKKFFPECPDEGAWASDVPTIQSLLEEVHPIDVAAQLAAQIGLHSSAEELVADNWPAIDGLASALLAKGNTALPGIEVQQGWSGGKRGTERFMPGPEIVEFFKRIGLTALILPEQAEGVAFDSVRGEADGRVSSSANQNGHPATFRENRKNR